MRLPPPPVRPQAELLRTLSRIHERRCRLPCKTRFRLAGCASTGRGSNPLNRFERFQVSRTSPVARVVYSWPEEAVLAYLSRYTPPRRHRINVRRAPAAAVAWSSPRPSRVRSGARRHRRLPLAGGRCRDSSLRSPGHRRSHGPSAIGWSYARVEHQLHSLANHCQIDLAVASRQRARRPSSLPGAVSEQQRAVAAPPCTECAALPAQARTRHLQWRHPKISTMLVAQATHLSSADININAPPAVMGGNRPPFELNTNSH
jgi:hypothetical protein